MMRVSSPVQFDTDEARGGAMFTARNNHRQIAVRRSFARLI